LRRITLGLATILLQNISNNPLLAAAAMDDPEERKNALPELVELAAWAVRLAEKEKTKSPDDFWAGVGSADAGTQLLLDELLADPDIPRNWRTLDLDAPAVPFLTIEMQKGATHLKFFTTLTTLGTPTILPSRAAHRELLPRRRGY
jgi:hypothetical protein